MISFVWKAVVGIGSLIQQSISNDIINASLEFIGALFILSHCKALYKAKDSAAISLTATLFFFGWGLWNIHWFEYIHMPYSLGAGMLMAAANAIWLSMIIHYRKKK